MLCFFSTVLSVGSRASAVEEGTTILLKINEADNTHAIANFFIICLSVREVTVYAKNLDNL